MARQRIELCGASESRRAGPGSFQAAQFDDDGIGRWSSCRGAPPLQ
jgi:hypothetical protein